MLILGVIVFYSFTLVHSQETLTLQQCVDRALEQSLDVQSSYLDIVRAESTLRTSKHSRFPNANASIGYGENWGRTIDPATNNFRNTNLSYNSYNLSSGVVLFGGGQINRSIKASKLDHAAALESAAQVKDDVALAVVSTYLRILFAEDNLKNVQDRLTNSQQQLDRMVRLINAGSQPGSARFELESQVASDEQMLIEAENQLELTILELKHLLQVPNSYNFDLQRPDIDRLMVDEADILEEPFDSIYQTALRNQPQIGASRLQEESAELGEKIARSNYLPSLTLGGSVGTNYSSEAKDITTTVTDVVEDVPVTINGIPATLGFPSQEITIDLDNTPYWDQFENNIGYGVSLNLSIPIYNNNSVKNNVANAQIFTEQTKINNERIKQNLRTSILSSMTDAKGARKAFVASEKAQEAAQISFENTQKQLEYGTGNNFDFLAAQNNLSTAETNVLRAQYDFIFKLKVLNYYMGLPLEF